jgi:DNA-directed RNA polymerase specialized sigma24 family protein
MLRGHRPHRGPAEVRTPVEPLDAVLAETCVPSLVFEPGTFAGLAAFGRGVVEAGGIRGQDADALVQRVLSELRAGPLAPHGQVTLRAALRHRLHLASLHFWRAERRRRAALVRAGQAGATRATLTRDPMDDAHDERARVREALGRLRASDREVLRLAYFAALPLESVRQILGYRTLDVLYVRLSQARARLREFLGAAEAP